MKINKPEVKKNYTIRVLPSKMIQLKQKCKKEKIKQVNVWDTLIELFIRGK